MLKVTSAAGRSALLTADIEADVERTAAGERPIGNSALTSATCCSSRITAARRRRPSLSSTPSRPLVAVFQVGYRNRFHHPHPTVFQRYQLRAIELSRSDDDGAARIELSSSITLERYRQTHARYWMDRVTLPRTQNNRVTLKGSTSSRHGLKDIIHFSHANGFPASTYRTIFAELADDYEIRIGRTTSAMIRATR